MDRPTELSVDWMEMECTAAAAAAAECDVLNDHLSGSVVMVSSGEPVVPRIASRVV